ncbi:MAG: arylsulfatase [Saprospiraceae bacterium]|nr:arylsulfatase [Saprospiraceae bacterium]
MKTDSQNATRFCLPWLICGIFILCGCQPPKPAVRPNIVVLLVDDLGYGDLRCYNTNSLVPTPHLDRLASQGMRFTRAYCPVAVCSPTRYALMTGQYPFRSWRKSGVMRNYEPSMIDSSLVTLPEMLQDAGYNTAGFGKWHLGTTFPTLDGKDPAGYGQFRADDNGANLDLQQPVSDSPMDHGFDRWLGFSCASECWIFDQREIIAAIGHDLYTIEATPNKEHIQDIPLQDYLPYITDQTLAYLDQTASQDDPFFLYFAPYVPHIPLAVSEEFRGKTDGGLYGDYVHELDHYIGLLLRKLDELKIADNTIVIFASDNGSQFRATSKAMDLTKASNSPNDVVSPTNAEDVHQPNAPLRGTKWTVYEGGVRTPMIIRWPKQVAAGSKADQIFGLHDWMASLAAMLKYDIPPGSALDSKDQLSVFTGTDLPIRNEIVVRAGNRIYGLIEQNWKFIDRRTDSKWTDEDVSGELYNLAVDVEESNNLFKSHPDVVVRMRKKLERTLAGQDDLNAE